MKSIEEQMSTYAAYHQDPRNKATHFVGVPVIVLSLFIPLAWLRIGDVSLAMVLAAAVIVYYLVLDVPLGLAMLVVFAALAWLGEWIALHGAAIGWSWFAVLFIGGWILQFIGHYYEGKRPALVDNIFQGFIGPMFLVAEALVAMGQRGDLAQAMGEGDVTAR